MLVATDVAGDARVVREARTLAAAGHEVTVIGRDVPAGYVPPEGVTVESAGGRSTLSAAADRMRGRRLPPHLRVARWALLPRHRRQAFGSWARAARQVAGRHKADVVHAHDFTALPVGASIAQEQGARLVYDTHEFWPGRARLHRPTPLEDRHDGRTEARLGAQADAVLTVGAGVARLLRERYGWEDVVVVRNSFEGGPASDVPLPAEPVAAVYAGRIAPFRDLETVAAAAPRLAPLTVLAVGPADPAYLARLPRDRIEVREPLPVDDVDGVLRGSGVALVTLSARWANHLVALPNKLFHAVRAGVPVVATDHEEMRAVVTEHGIGALYPAGDVAALAGAVHEVVDRYADLVAAVERARPALSWEHDARTLLEVYEGLAR
jgi:glycogen(starch) synthase